MDILATSLDYMGLAFLKDAGLFQMLRVTPMLWCAILSIPILRQRVKWFQWFGMFVVVGGIFIKAIPLLFPPSGKSEVNNGLLIVLFTFPLLRQAYQMGCIEEFTYAGLENHSTLFYPDSNLTLWGPEWTFSSEEVREDSGSSCGNTCLKGIGIGMVLVGEVIIYN